MKNKKAFSLIELSVVILIIGILVAGITQSSRLINQFRLSSARSITQSSPLHSIRNIYFWLDTTAENAFDADVEDGSAVINFYDQNKQRPNQQVNFIQNTLTNRPTYVANGINNLPVLRFDGVDNYMQSVNTINIFDISPNSENTIFFVGNISNNTAFPGYFNIQNGDGSQRIYFTSFGGTSRFTYVLDITNSINGGSLLNGPTIVTLEKRGSNQTIYLDGISSSTVSNHSSSFTDFTSNFFLASQVSFMGFAQIDIAELIVFSGAIKAEERESVEEYLSKKWNIDVN